MFALGIAFSLAINLCKIAKGCLLSSSQSKRLHLQPLPATHPPCRHPAPAPHPSAYQTSTSATDKPRTHPPAIPAPAALRDAGKCSRAPTASRSHSPRKPARPSPRPPSPRPASEPRSPHTTAPTHSHNSPFAPAHEMLNSVHKTHASSTQAEHSPQVAHTSIIAAGRRATTKRRASTDRPALDPQSPRRRPRCRTPLVLGHALPPLVSTPVAT